MTVEKVSNYDKRLTLDAETRTRELRKNMSATNNRFAKPILSNE